MTEGVVGFSGSALSPATVSAIERRMVIGPTAVIVARRAAVALVKPKVTKVIPYVGWAIAIGSAVYAGYEAYKATEVQWAKMEAETYDEADMAVFRIGYTEASRVFERTADGLEAAQNGWKFILIPSEVMPMVAAVDAVGMATYGNVLQWDPANKAARRYKATRGLPPAGPIAYQDGSTLRGSWEEYPFASTWSSIPGAHIDRVPLRENWIQGGFIRAAASVQGFEAGETVRTFIL